MGLSSRGPTPCTAAPRLSVVVQQNRVHHPQARHVPKQLRIFPEGWHVLELPAALPTLCFILFSQGLCTLLPLPEDVHRAVDRLPLRGAGGHGCQLLGVLHHPLHRRSLRCPHLHHLHLRGSGEADLPGRDLPCAHAQQA